METKEAKTGIAKHLAWPAILILAGLPAVLFYAGCAPQIVAVIATPTNAEKEDAAEYNINPKDKKDQNQKILVLVDQPTYLSEYPNLRFYLTDIINRMLEEKAKIKKSLLIEYQKVADFRLTSPDAAILSPAQIGEKLGADLVLEVSITDCKVREVADGGFFSGALDAHAALYRVSSGEKLWPTSEQSRFVQVGFESERRGRDAAVVRLAAAAAHCVTRYLYNCPKAGFKISDERTASGW